MTLDGGAGLGRLWAAPAIYCAGFAVSSVCGGIGAKPMPDLTAYLEAWAMARAFEQAALALMASEVRAVRS